MNRSVWVQALCLLAFGAAVGCAQNDNSIPKLVSLEQFSSETEEEVIGSALEYTTPKLDILFVIDESGSMSRYQQSLSQNIDMFLEVLRKVDRLSYRIAVTTSGPADNSPHYRHPNATGTVNGPPLGVFQKGDDSEPSYISNNTPYGMELLRERLMPGDRGSAHEKFFEPVLNALTRADQLDFLRDDAYLAIFFLTDAEDISTFIDVETLHERIVAIKGGRASKVLAYGAVIPSAHTQLPPGCTRDDQGPPVNIEAFIEMTGGKIFDICSPDYGVELARVGQELGEAVGTGTVLTEIPAPETIRVYAGTRLIPNEPLAGWVYMPETNEIVFGSSLDVREGEAIRVTYTRANEFRQ